MGENYKKYLKKGSAFLVAPALFGGALPGSNASAVDLSSSLNTIGNFVRVFPEWAYAFLSMIFGNNKTLKEEIDGCAKSGSAIDTNKGEISVLNGGCFWYEIRYANSPYYQLPYIFIRRPDSKDCYLVLPGSQGNRIFKYEGISKDGFCKNLELFDLNDEKIYQVPGVFYKPDYIYNGSIGLNFGKDQIEKCRLVSLGKYGSRRAELRDIGVCLNLIRSHDRNENDWKQFIFPAVGNTN